MFAFNSDAPTHSQDAHLEVNVLKPHHLRILLDVLSLVFISLVLLSKDMVDFKVHV